MTGGPLQLFGGGWTESKLAILGQYLGPYAKVMKKQHFECYYIDAFAGTGYREVDQGRHGLGIFAKELAEDEPQAFLDGSPKIALKVDPPFHRYVFIERSPKRFAELGKLKEEFPRLAERMEFRRKDANSVLQELCGHWSRGSMRGVLFLDPFGMQVDWATLESVARTKAIDVWILFPLGIAAR